MRAERFEESNRWVRGRVVAALAAGEGVPRGIAPERLAPALAGPLARRPDPAGGGRLRARLSRPWPSTARASCGPTSPATAGATTRPRSTPISDRIADEVEELRRRAAVPAPLSAQAGDQVKAIVEAAERGAQEIRDAAHADAREHVAHVTAAADPLRERIEQMERDMTQLVIDLRTGAERLRGDLDGLQAGTDALAEVRHEAPARGGTRARPARRAPAPGVAEAPKNGDSAAARIVALDMALSGTPREDTDRYLAENYDVPGPRGAARRGLRRGWRVARRFCRACVVRARRGAYCRIEGRVSRRPGRPGSLSGICRQTPRSVSFERAATRQGRRPRPGRN